MTSGNREYPDAYYTEKPFIIIRYPFRKKPIVPFEEEEEE
jgi:hypothetical protein